MLVPERPFRVVVSGEGIDGESYRRVLARLFSPTSGPQTELRVPKGTLPAKAKRMREMLEEANRQSISAMEMRLKKYPDGVMIMPRTRLSNVTYAPLLSNGGRPLGLRISYDVEFSQDGYYNPELHVFPAYENEDWRTLIEMRTLNGSIEPLPAEAGGPQLRPNILAFGAGYIYRGDTTYHFVAELVPDYIIQNEEKTKVCIYRQKYRYTPALQATWEALLASDAPTKYRVYIDNTDFDGQIEDFFAQGTLYKNFMAEGALDCGEMPTNHF
jgi:hypothetical protein